MYDKTLTLSLIHKIFKTDGYFSQFYFLFSSKKNPFLTLNYRLMMHFNESQSQILMGALEHVMNEQKREMSNALNASSQFE